MSIEVEISADEFADLSQKRQNKVLFSAVMGIDKKLSIKTDDHEDRLKDLELCKRFNIKLSAGTGIIGGMITMALYIFGKITFFKNIGG